MDRREKRIAVLIFIVAVLGSVSLAYLRRPDYLRASYKESQVDLVQGEWRVVSVNCPTILAENGSGRRIFAYHAPKGMMPYEEDGVSVSKSALADLCRSVVKPGWIVVTERESNRYEFFPAPTTTAITGN
jgi:hypothetical protein